MTLPAPGRRLAPGLSALGLLALVLPAPPVVAEASGPLFVLDLATPDAGAPPLPLPAPQVVGPGLLRDRLLGLDGRPAAGADVLAFLTDASRAHRELSRDGRGTIGMFLAVAEGHCFGSARTIFARRG